MIAIEPRRRGARHRAPLRRSPDLGETSGDHRLLAFLVVAILVAGCGAEQEPTGAPASPTAGPTPTGTAEPPGGGGGGSGRIDPRDDGFDVAFGEFSVELEAEVIRPGPVTFVIHNGGELVHGFEMELEGDDDSSGSGSGDDGFKVETESIQPGETIELELDLAPGVYKVECFVDGHDDLGMEALLEVRPDAPLLRRGAGGGGGSNAVAIEGFEFRPERLEVRKGAEITWTNQDSAEHTVTSVDGAFDSGGFGRGATFSHRFNETGTFAYRCNIHPSMEGTIVVG